jgi:hypothetical protein
MDRSLKRGWNTLVAGAALACLFLGSAPAFANITYLVDQTVGVGGVTGSITTNGVLGTLLPANILSWSLELTGDGASLHLTDLNSIVYGAGSDVVATSSNITFDYSSGDQGYLVFQQPAGVGNGHFYWCNAAPAGGYLLRGHLSGPAVRRGHDRGIRAPPRRTGARYGAGTVDLGSYAARLRRAWAWGRPSGRQGSAGPGEGLKTNASSGLRPFPLYGAQRPWASQRGDGFALEGPFIRYQPLGRDAGQTPSSQT